MNVEIYNALFHEHILRITFLKLRFRNFLLKKSGYDILPTVNIERFNEFLFIPMQF